ncbi:MAG: choice-of-anchor E domain-containing protein [Crocosphaera sp.]
MKKTLLASLLMLSCTGLVLSNPVSALTLRQTRTNFSQPLRFNGFNSSLGTLTGVRLDYNLSAIGSAVDPSRVCWFYRDCEGFFVLDIDGSGVFSSLFNRDFDYVTNFEVDNGVIVNLFLIGSRSFNPSSFVDVPTVGNIFVDFFATGDLATNRFINRFLPNPFGTVRLSYQYTPIPEFIPTVDVPETTSTVDVPETTSILGLVAMGVGLVASKGRKQG